MATAEVNEDFINDHLAKNELLYLTLPAAFNKLPRHIKALLDVCAPEQVHRLVNSAAGKSVSAKRACLLLLDPDDMDEQQSSIIEEWVKRYGDRRSNSIKIPGCHSALCRVRAELVALDFVNMSGDHTVRQKVSILAKQYKVTTRTVWRLLNVK